MSTSRAWRGWPYSDVPTCARCAAAPPPDQLALFEPDSGASDHVGETIDGSSAFADRGTQLWPRVETSACGRPGFWRPRTPSIFGPRAGVGPLLAFPDSNILISLHQQLEETEAFTLRAAWSDRRRPVDALHDLVQLWWWRDVRFRVSSEHLSDAKKPMTAERRAARRAAVSELRRDYEDRGGCEPVIADLKIVMEDQPCALHSIPFPEPTVKAIRTAAKLLPQQGKDKVLVLKALEDGCHVFVTCDKKVLHSNEAFSPLGLTILSPAQLLERLDASGELDECENPWTAPAPDLSALTRFYGAFAKECFEQLRHETDKT